jgi:hypothetical protein
MLRRAGYSDEFVRDVLSQLPNPIDLQRDEDPRTLRLEPRATDGSHGRRSLTGRRDCYGSWLVNAR